MSLRIGAHVLNSPVLLAPMAGITDLPFRRVAARFGVGLAVSEMVASREMATGRASTLLRAELSGDELSGGTGLTSVQIAGREARDMAECARRCVGRGARIIDINMGCPAKKVTQGASGAALMRDPDHALGLIEAVVAAADAPVTLKMRLGWDRATMTAPQIARRAEAAGVAMIVVHGRTRQQFYRGAADWDAVRAVRAAVTVPLVVNGDVVDAASARDALRRSGADGVMIGRGARGRPWLPAQIAAALAGRPGPATPTGAARAALLIGQCEDMLDLYGRDLGLRCARKHLSWHLEHVPGAAGLRARLMRMDDPARVAATLAAELPDIDAAAQALEAAA